MLTSFAEDELLFNAISAGAVGYVLKQVGNDDLVRAIETVARGDAMLDPGVTGQVLAKLRDSTRSQAFTDLSERELKVLALIAQGKTNREIATHLYLGEGTVRNYVSNILDKLGLSNRAEATAYAVRHNLVRVFRVSSPRRAALSPYLPNLCLLIALLAKDRLN
jgi:DNA-binding NarL/FixJ family response regulator